MFLPKKFAMDDLRALDALVDRDAFVTLVSQVDGVPFATHLPVLYRRDGERVVFVGHWARGNRQWQDIASQQVLLIVHGPHAYVSPTWYADPAATVPTWNYAVAHVLGRVRVSHDSAELSALVAALSHQYEAGIGSDWHFPDSSPGSEQELAGIVGFELEAERIQIKHKLNQHHDRVSIRGAIAGLRGCGDSGSMEVAAMMEQVLGVHDA